MTSRLFSRCPAAQILTASPSNPTAAPAASDRQVGAAKYSTAAAKKNPSVTLRRASWRTSEIISALIATVLVVVYMTLTLAAAIRTEEAFLRERFGDAYDAYSEARGPRVERRFSFERAWRNREYRALGGLALFLCLLVLRMWLAH